LIWKSVFLFFSLLGLESASLLTSPSWLFSRLITGSSAKVFSLLSLSFLAFLLLFFDPGSTFLIAFSSSRFSANLSLAFSSVFRFCFLVEVPPF